MARRKGLGWDLESLNKAYRQGYMAGTLGMVRQNCPYQSAVVVAAWEAGWEDGSILRVDEQPAMEFPVVQRIA